MPSAASAILQGIHPTALAAMTTSLEGMLKPADGTSTQAQAAKLATIIDTYVLALLTPIVAAIDASP
jgi:hypothetical protein